MNDKERLKEIYRLCTNISEDGSELMEHINHLIGIKSTDDNTYRQLVLLNADLRRMIMKTSEMASNLKFIVEKEKEDEPRSIEA